MQCVHPLRAWRTPTGEIKIGRHEHAKRKALSATFDISPNELPLQLPCGGCLTCRMAYAQAWALRCQFELQQHKSAVFTTLTYDDAHVPITLPRPEETLPLWIKRLRKHTKTKLRFYASAEYGELTKRPHYHVLLYGLHHLKDANVIQDTWNDGTATRYTKAATYGHTRTEEITPARIAYTAGYCHKKVDYKHIRHERVDPETGEVYIWQPPHKLMSRNPGIGGEARKWATSWRMFAIKDGHKMPVPRYLHEAWKTQATEQQKEDLIYEKSKLPLKDTTEYTLNAIKKITEKQQEQNHQKRRY